MGAKDIKEFQYQVSRHGRPFPQYTFSMSAPGTTYVHTHTHTHNPNLITQANERENLKIKKECRNTIQPFDEILTHGNTRPIVLLYVHTLLEATLLDHRKASIYQ